MLPRTDERAPGPRPLFVASFRTALPEEMRAQVKHAANDMPVVMGALQGHTAVLGVACAFSLSCLVQSERDGFFFDLRTQ